MKEQYEIIVEASLASEKGDQKDDNKDRSITRHLVI